MGEKNGDARTFWMELEDGGKVDFIFEQVQNVLQSLKQKIKDGSATNKEYIQAMILVNQATLNNNSTLIKDDTAVTQNEQENKSSSLSSTSCQHSFPEDSTLLSAENKEILPLENKGAEDVKEKASSWNVSYQRHVCSGACLIKMPFTSKGGNPLQLPIQCHFQRLHSKTNSHSTALHVSYKTPCGRILRNMKEVFRYLIETECNFLFTDNFSFNTYVQLTRNYEKQEVISDVDISNGVESVPISFCNDIDNRKLPHFKYRKTMWPRTYYLSSFSDMFTDSCDCAEGCIDIAKCACLQLTARNAKSRTLSSDPIPTGYKYRRLQRQVPTGIYECSLLCKCSRHRCQNRVVQRGPQVRLQVFKTEKKGWGVRCLDDIDRGTFICIYSGRLLSRANTEKSGAVDENGKEKDTIQNTFSKKRKMGSACSECEVEVIPLELEALPRGAEAEECPPKFSNEYKEPIREMKCNNSSRIPYHSVIRSSKHKASIFQYNGKKLVKTGFTSSESVTSEENHGSEPSLVQPNSQATETKEDSTSDQVENLEDMVLSESDVIDITKCRETPPEIKFTQALPLDNQRTMKKFEVQTPQEEKSSASQSQQAVCGEESPNEIKYTSSDGPRKFNTGNIFLLDATKEGNVGRFLNHSCCPNLLVQNVFAESHDRNFPMVAFFTNRYVKARTELTWDYGYEAGSMPEKEILCQCGTNKCRKKIL
ncbi:histone-lysine N-methyltransferase SETDB2 [Echinops telfairi]|uniref:Histone-lysine N-methyltransferase SETDB2 n=1 Tax=Echinops telfairi TaxID=9371 RepID=A0AC55CZS3_ECHTE|nr:histone-lysine N-methyltransferase SETDB2 [Echinops telfairi]